MARKHQKGKGPASGTDPSGTEPPGIDPDVALFASYMRDEEQRERDAKRAAREARRQADAAQGLAATKDVAAAEVKRLRGRQGVSAEQRAAADAAYRDALAAVVGAETGATPAWAPPSPSPEAGPGPTEAAESAEGEPQSEQVSEAMTEQGAESEVSGDMAEGSVGAEPDDSDGADAESTTGA